MMANINRSVSALEQSNIEVGRSVFSLDHSTKTTMGVGKLIPIDLYEVLPGDTFDITVSMLARMSTPIFPVMDNAYLDYYFFFVPNRLVWDNWQAFNGENDVSSWINEDEHIVPCFNWRAIMGAASSENSVSPPLSWLPYGSTTSPSGNYWESIFSSFSLWDYYGLPVGRASFANYPGAYSGIKGTEVSALPFRGYHLIWNDFFRAQDFQAPFLIEKGDLTATDLNTPGYFLPHPVNRFHDYFSNCLPAPQKGPSVLIPGLVGSTVSTSADAFTSPTGVGLVFNSSSNVFSDVSSVHSAFAPINPTGQPSVNSARLDFISYPNTDSSYGADLSPQNLAVVSSPQATIGSLRTAFQIQKLFERDLHGTRYTEILRNHFGVLSPDGRQQRPELLGYGRVPLNMSQVVQSSSTDSTSPQGNVSGYSLTSDRRHSFVKSFTEHGYIHLLACVRTDQSYQNNISRTFLRKRRFDFYYPALANITNQPVYNVELFSGNSIDNFESLKVFGYNEAWADYRYKPSNVTGAFRSNYPQSLDAYHYADNYGGIEARPSTPILSSDWLVAPDNVSRTLAVTDSPNEEVLCDFFFQVKRRAPMPVHSIPGLVDHF